MREDSAPCCGRKRRHQDPEGDAFSLADPVLEKNFWRFQAILGEERQQKVDAKSERFATFKAMEQETLSYAKSTVGVPSFLRASFVDFDNLERRY